MKLNDIKPEACEFSCVYMWENLINHKRYIGQTDNFGRRMLQYSCGHFNKYMAEEVKEFGIDNFEISILEKDLSETQLAEREQYWMDYYCSYNEDKGYNRMRIGGNMTEASQKNRTYEEMYGNDYAKEKSKNHSEWMKNKWATDEAYRKFWSEKMSGENNYFYGVHMCGGENPHAKAIRCIETQKVYETIREAAKDVGISRQNIQNALKGRQKTAGGYHWKYV